MRTFRYILIFTISIIMSACYKEQIITPGSGLADWTNATHSSNAPVNYEVVFPQNKVNRLDITIDADDWEVMQDDIDNLYGPVSTGGGGPGGGGGGTPGGVGNFSFSDQNPVYVPCNVEFNGKNWYYVGIRYKGNSSLSAYGSGVKKLPFRLEFDQFADDYPEITGQTFYGFPALSMSSNYEDVSFLREKVGCDMFRNFDVPAPYSAFYEMYVDYGDGPVYFGLYTGVEIVFETLLNKQFGNNSGNCYKPEDDGATFSTAGFSLKDFENKTTGGTGEADIQNLYNILQASTRTSDTTAWKSAMESVFDVQVFLKWLAVNTTIQNWDTYGRMSHNYYLYNNPTNNLINWIPWDNNEAFMDGGMGGALTFEFSEINGADWPLIKYILSIPGYEANFKTHILIFIETTFKPSTMEAYYTELENLISTSVNAESSDYSFLNNPSEFSFAISQLKTHVNNRESVARSYAE